MSLANNVLIGIISGIISSLIVLLILACVKPKIKISDEICTHLDTNSSKKIYKIKVVNLTRSMLTNVHYNLYYCVEYRDNIISMQEIPPRKTPLTIIEKYARDDENADYAVRITYFIDEKKYPLADNVKFKFVFYANHVLTNASICKKRSIIKVIFLRMEFLRLKSL